MCKRKKKVLMSKGRTYFILVYHVGEKKKERKLAVVTETACFSKDKI